MKHILHPGHCVFCRFCIQEAAYFADPASNDLMYAAYFASRKLRILQILHPHVRSIFCIQEVVYFAYSASNVPIYAAYFASRKLHILHILGPTSTKTQHILHPESCIFCIFCIQHRQYTAYFVSRKLHILHPGSCIFYIFCIQHPQVCSVFCIQDAKYTKYAASGCKTLHTCVLYAKYTAYLQMLDAKYAK